MASEPSEETGEQGAGGEVRALLERACRRLLDYDPDIVEIARFGSSVYAPECAKDVDILVLTRRAKDYGGYLDALEAEDLPFDVDVVVVELGRKVGRELLVGVLGAFEVLHGTGRYILEYARSLGDPTFDEARAALRAARDYMGLALKADDALLRDRHAKEAFNALFHAARLAAMTYLSTEVSRWGLVRRMLPEPYKSKFQEFINVLHIEYFYHGRYPRDRLEEEFDRWYREVEEFTNRLEREARGRKSASSTKGADGSGASLQQSQPGGGRKQA